jgi:hypothetical protein
MSQEFQVMCSAFYAVYEPLLKILAATLAGMGVLVGVVLGVTMGLRRAFLGAP